MTGGAAPQPTDELREVLELHRIAAFAASEVVCYCDSRWRTLAEYREHQHDALLPVVLAYADQRAAEELRYRADLIEARAYDESATPDEAARDALSETAAWLHARAAALAAREREA